MNDSANVPPPRVCAVSFLNTVPLIWGFLHGPQRGRFDLSTAVPSQCADLLERGGTDVGLVPVVEIPRLGLRPVPGVGIACRGAVRSILLVSKTPLRQIRALAADSNSRSSVALARIILERRYGVRPEFRRHAPDLAAMLASADAAVVIGDSALGVEPSHLPYPVFDLGQEWMEMTGLPMVFAMWAARPGVDTTGFEDAFIASWRFGMSRLDDIVERESAPRGLAKDMVRHYLTRSIVFEIGEEERMGMARYLEYARQSGILVSTGATTA